MKNEEWGMMVAVFHFSFLIVLRPPAEAVRRAGHDSFVIKLRATSYE
jgi:hypothetical protein